MSTDIVEEQKRFALWRDLICNVLVNLDAVQLSPAPFSGRIETGFIGEVQISEIVSDAHHASRSSRHIAKANEDYFHINLQVQGRGFATQDDRAAELTPGDFVLDDSTRPYTMHFGQPFRMIVFQFPRRLLNARCSRLDYCTAIRLPSEGRAAGSLVATFLQNVASCYRNLDQVARLRVAETVLDLLAVAFGDLAGVQVAAPTSVGAAHRMKARAYISAHLGDPNLSPSSVAANLFISVRYLHKLFEAEDASIEALIKDQRLERCRREIADSRQAGRTITEIALSWGFSDPAYFSRAFRRRYGRSPREYRVEATQIS